MTLDTPTETYEKPEVHHAWPMRLWLAAPDWLFRVLGLAFFAALIWDSSQKYIYLNFWELGPYYVFPDGRVLHIPWKEVLVDLTLVLIALSFLVRFKPRTRASDGRIVAFSLFTAFAPLLPFWGDRLLGMISPEWQYRFEVFLWRDSISLSGVLIGSALIMIGNTLDIWGYFVLCRSFGIVPEARELKTTGPYRFVRHPVYLGQFIAQAGVWLFFARLHIVWIGLYCTFVALQLYRSKLEDRVLEQAFGEEYLEWKRRTFWFV